MGCPRLTPLQAKSPFLRKQQRRRRAVQPPASQDGPVWQQGGVRAPAPRARGSGRCRCTRGGPSCSAHAAPPAGRRPRCHPWGQERCVTDGVTEGPHDLPTSNTITQLPAHGKCSTTTAVPHLEVECLDGVTILVVGEAPQEKALLLSLLFQALQGTEKRQECSGWGMEATKVQPTLQPPITTLLT